MFSKCLLITKFALKINITPIGHGTRKARCGSPCLSSYRLTTLARYFEHIEGKTRCQEARNSIEFVAQNTPKWLEIHSAAELR